MGTVVYLPPEADSGQYGTYTDAFSFGMVLYEMLQGVLPKTSVSTDGNDEWFHELPLFAYQHKAKDEEGNDAGIGAKLKQLVKGLTNYNYNERWTTEYALEKLQEIVTMHQKSKASK